MKNTIDHPSLSFNKIMLFGIYIIVGIVTIYFLATRAFPYLSFQYAQNAYGDFGVFIFAHVVFGITATLIGPFQFVSVIRNRNVKVHRMLGRIYLICTLLAALVSWYIILSKKEIGITYQAGLFSLGFVWIASGTMAYFSIKNKKVELHKEWMIRSYVITLAFVTFRLITDILEPLQIKGVGALMAWACWAVPLFFTELILQGKKIFK